ncbi:hypothetical protein COO60DRAFT_980526 [Scenedesmus sp. NREL 46B-D3]|nr:hypothetical protein COO60DRAFT_980526 [Scenedesmus sp. NREL 46B-D3]
MMTRAAHAALPWSCACAVNCHPLASPASTQQHQLGAQHPVLEGWRKPRKSIMKQWLSCATPCRQQHRHCTWFCRQLNGKHTLCRPARFTKSYASSISRHCFAPASNFYYK